MMRRPMPSSRNTLRWLTWAAVIMLLTFLVLWRPSVPIGTMAQDTHLPASNGMSMPHVSGPPWHYGSATARFTLILYADLECPYCRTYVPPLMAWIERHPDIRLQWHHVPLSMHEPAASQLAALAECAGEVGGSAAYWRAISWIYQHTRGGGLGLPDNMYPPDANVLNTCLASERPLAIVRAQAQDAVDNGVSATPTLQLRDERSGQSLWLQGPTQGDALLSAVDLLSVDDAALTTEAFTVLSAVSDGNKPRVARNRKGYGVVYTALIAHPVPHRIPRADTHLIRRGWMLIVHPLFFIVPGGFIPLGGTPSNFIYWRFLCSPPLASRILARN